MRAAFLIHGFASDREDFSRLAPILSAYYDEVLCPNLPAHGVGREKERLNHKVILEYVEKSFDLLKERHKYVDVYGFSMGGAIASYLGCNKDVNRIVLLAPANKYFAPFFVRDTVKWIFSVSREEKGKKVKPLPMQNNLTAAELKSDTADALKLFFGKMMKKINVKSLAEFSRLIKSCNNCLKDINAPTLIIWGKIDQLVPYSSLLHIVEHCRNDITKTIIWPDLSHLMLYSRLHHKITHEILCFLKDTDPPKLGYTPKNNNLEQKDKK